MKLGIITGTVCATRKAQELAGCRLCLIQPLNGDQQPIGRPIVAADPENIGGRGDKVVYVTSTDAAESFSTGRAPVDAAVVCLIDSISGV